MDASPQQEETDDAIGRVRTLAAQHPELAVLIGTGIGVVAGIALSSLIESDKSLERAKASRYASDLGRQLMQSLGSAEETAMDKLRSLLHG